MASTDAEDDALLWIALSQISGLGDQGLCKLLQAWGSPQAVFSASLPQLTETVSRNVAEAICRGPDLERLQASRDWLRQAGNHLITLADHHYPPALLQIADAPPLLYAKGNLHWLHSPAIAIVGSRNASVQGERDTEAFAEALSLQGYCIVSGMALGIDGAAHRGALKGSGATIAVVGTGLNMVYPSRHRELAHQIVARGLMLSEFHLGMPSLAHHFPRRNRIISGLVQGCLVVEANLDSGSLITARLAADQGREVFAMPGSIHSPLSKGCHALIKQGAKLVDSIQDILEELGHTVPAAPLAAPVSLPPSDHPLLACMDHHPVSMTTLMERSGLTSEELSAMLLVLELEGQIASLPGGRYQRIA